jgi:hypothetical protein
MLNEKDFMLKEKDSKLNEKDFMIRNILSLLKQSNVEVPVEFMKMQV